jgi:hypothetical protein
VRTTINIEASTLQILKNEAERSGLSLTAVVNKALKYGLDRLHPRVDREPFRAQTFSMGSPEGLDMTKALQLSSLLEDEEVIRKIQQRK